MDQNEQDPFSDEVSAGEVLVAAASAAGLIGGALWLAQRRRRQEEIADKAERVARDAGRLAADVVDLTGAVVGQAQVLAGERGKLARKMSKQAQAAAAERGKLARQVGLQAADTVREVAPQLAGAAPVLAASGLTAVKPLAARTGEASDAVLSMGMRLGDEVAQSSRLAAERAGLAARRLTEEVVPQTTQRVRAGVPNVTQTVVPAVTQVAGRATTSVTEAAVTRRRQLAEAARRAREESGAIAGDMGAVAGGQARKAGRQGGLFGRRLQTGTGEMLAALTAAGAASLVTSEKADREAQLARKNGAKTARKDDTRAARKAATKGGAQAAGTGRRKGRKARGPVATFVGDTIASSFWLTAAVGLLLFAFADQEQRERVINGARTFFEQATELYRDFQGYSEEM